MAERLSAKETALELGFTTTNLKHYASLLEQNGHQFFRNTRNHREYSRQDIDLLQAMTILNKHKSMLLEDAASFVMSSDTDIKDIFKSVEKRIDANIRVVAQDSEDDSRELSLINAFQNEYFQVLKDIQSKLDAQNDLILSQAKENHELKESLNNLNEEIKQLRDTYEMQLTKPNWFKRFFNYKKENNLN